jgi:hypothetical protein
VVDFVYPTSPSIGIGHLGIIHRNVAGTGRDGARSVLIEAAVAASQENLFAIIEWIGPEGSDDWSSEI